MQMIKISEEIKQKVRNQIESVASTLVIKDIGDCSIYSTML